MRNIFIFLFGLGLIACDGSENGTSTTNDFDRSLMLTQVADEIIVPGYTSFTEDAQELDLASQKFLKDLTLENLVELQEVWLSAKLSWKELEVYSFGPIYDLALENQIELWPSYIDGIESSLSSADADTNFSTLLGSNRKGLSAIEYLIFSNDSQTILEQFEEENRQLLLAFYTSDIVSLADQVLSEWTTNGYRDIFVSLTSNDAASGSSQLANEIIFAIETVQKEKIATPLGFTNATDPNPELVESYFAAKSSECIINNLTSARLLFNGGDGSGFDDYLDALNIYGDDEMLLSDIINDQFDVCIELVKSWDTPLQTMLKEDVTPVNEMYDELQVLIMLLKTQMMSQLSLTVTYSDNDGD